MPAAELKVDRSFIVDLPGGRRDLDIVRTIVTPTVPAPDCASAAEAARGADTPGGYLMDHSRMAYLMGKNGEPIAALPVDKDPATVAADLAALVK